MLDILLIVAAVIVALLALGGMIAFNQHIGREFGHRFFAWRRLLLGGVAVAAIAGGVSGFLGSEFSLAAIAAGAVIVLGLSAYNIRRTNLAMGLIGSSMEIGLYATVGFFGIALALPALMIAVATAFGRAEPSLRQNHLYHDHPSFDS